MGIKSTADLKSLYGEPASTEIKGRVVVGNAFEEKPVRVCKLGDSRHYIPQGKSECYCGTEKRKKMLD